MSSCIGSSRGPAVVVFEEFRGRAAEEAEAGCVVVAPVYAAGPHAAVAGLQKHRVQVFHGALPNLDLSAPEPKVTPLLYTSHLQMGFSHSSDSPSLLLVQKFQNLCSISISSVCLVSHQGNALRLVQWDDLPSLFLLSPRASVFAVINLKRR